ncbi:hypothetical protein AMS68_007094 [Peltaster fructicola]|uniref:cyclin-dependent kinase n=1 Tax=Peltaster fructicola TaxID=286661 RepID=A0A6H0Y3I6_9PEZI|nr:hypothetical protein AMS68_007094 [Peltaster fructicola]
MQGRGSAYGWGHNQRQQNQSQYYGYTGYPQYPYNQTAQGYGQQAQYQQTPPYGHQQYGYQSGFSQTTNQPFQPPLGPAYGNNTGSQYAQRGNARGGGSMRGNRAAPYSNMSWKASDGYRNGRAESAPQQEEMKSVIAAPDTSIDESDNPFRPPANLRAEDEDAERERMTAEQSDKATPVHAPTGNTPTGPRNQSAISFSIKPRPKPNTDTGQSKSKRQGTPEPRHRAASPESPLNELKSRDDSRRASPAFQARKEPAPRTKTVKRKVLKPKPTLSEEHAQSDSVYYRKTGNESVVGSGTYGKVYKATHVYTGKMVALKKIRMEGERDGFPITAIREIKLLQSLRHRNVVPLREVMVERNDCYMVFEYLHHDLTGLLNHPSFVLSPGHKKHLAKQLFEGLDYLHRRGVLHRDIKAANILISKTGELKLADFGLARFYQKRSKEDYTNRVITIWYRPPELLLGETQYDGAVDIWSAACVLVEIFLRHAIFPGNGSEIDQLDKIYNVLGTPSRSEWPGIVELQWYELLRPSQRIPSTLSEKFRDRVSPDAFELLQAMFAYDPANRPTAADVLEHAYFTTEEPAAAQVVELENLEGDWHEFESKQLRKEKEKERKRRERERDTEKRKRDESIGGEAKKIKTEA